jgi:hypothetical protein
LLEMPRRLLVRCAANMTRREIRFIPWAMFAAFMPGLGCAPAIDFQPRSDRYAKCAVRPEGVPAARGVVTLVGAVQQIDDETAVDGPVRLVIIDLDGQPRRLFFGSLFTRPAPSERRKATYRDIASSRIGDCIQARGTTMPDGQLWLEDFVRLE